MCSFLETRVTMHAYQGCNLGGAGVQHIMRDAVEPIYGLYKVVRAKTGFVKLGLTTRHQLSCNLTA